MIRNLTVNSNKFSIRKLEVHKLIKSLKDDLNFQIYALVINFVDTYHIHNINKEYLKHDYSTDIITFNYSENISLLDGEIIISVPDAAVNAKRYKVSLNKELNRLVIHGTLHLTGYDDQKKTEKKIMKTLENRLTYKNNFALL